MLQQAVHQRTAERPALIENLVYEHTALLLVSDSGVGKSTLFIQLVAQASCGQAVFGICQPVRPLRVYYLMSERDFWEPADRLIHMESSVPLVWDNIVIDAECVGLNLRKETHREIVLRRLDKIHPQIVVVDPIYSFFEGGLSGDELATLIGRFSSTIQNTVGASVIFGHHSVKNPKQPNGDGQWVERPYLFYGSQFIRAHVTGYYDILPSATGTTWQRKKDTYGVLRPAFSLTYDKATGLSHGVPEVSSMDKREQFRQFLHHRFLTKQPFQVQEVLKSIRMTDRYLRDLVRDPEFSPFLHIYSTNAVDGGSNTYEVLMSPLK